MTKPGETNTKGIGNRQNFSNHTLDLCRADQLPGQDTETFLAAFAYLEEALQPPDLEDALAHQDAHLEYAPPLHAPVGGLSCVAVDALAEDDVGLLVFDLGEEL